ncbi:MAG: helix-turn-helix domain-containing protein [Pseudomonadota bacterium]
MSNPDIQFRRKSPVALADCGAALALEQLPDRWTWLILRALLYDVGRFADIHAEIGVPKSVLSGRLAQLIENGLARKIAYREGTSRTRHAYVLTAKGRALAPVMLALMHWGDTYLNEGDSALDLFDTRSGTPVEVGIVAKGADVPLRWLGFEPADKKHEAE